MSQLGIDLWGMLWQAVAFGILVYLLHRLMYRPTLNMIDSRAEQIRKGVEESENAQRRAREVEADASRMLSEARQKSQETIAEAAKASESVRQEILEQARQEAARTIQDARQQIETERKQALASVRDQIVDLSMEATRRVLQQGIDQETQRRLIEQFLEHEVRSGNGEDGN